MELNEICQFLDDFLKIEEFTDASANGLQVEGRGEVRKIAFAVDACMESFKAAYKIGADLLVVHHGLVWGGIKYIRSIVKKRIKFLLDTGISLYAAHLPLDAHPEIGNNASILKIINAKIQEPFGEYKGVRIGYLGSFNYEKNLTEILNSFRFATVLSFGPEKIKTVGVVSGRGGFAIEEAIEKKLDLFITGEAEHEVYHLAREGGINVTFLGHYESEKFGLLNLSKIISSKFGVETVFIDVPTNL